MKRFRSARKLPGESMKAGKQMFRNHPAFGPPEPTVQQRSTASETFEVKRHFIFADQYLLDVSPYKDNALREREIPEHGWVWGIYREFDPSKEGKGGYITCYRRNTEAVDKLRIQHNQEDSVHAGQGDIIASQLQGALRSAGRFGDTATNQLFTVKGSEAQAQKLASEGRSSQAPGTPPASKISADDSPGSARSSNSPFAWVRKRLGNAKSKAKRKAKATKCSKRTVNVAAKSSVGGLSAEQAEMRQQNEEIVETLKRSIQMTSDLK